MLIEKTISKINKALISAFAVIDSWFDQPEEVLKQQCDNRWSPAEILEHIMLTNHFLLKLIDKGSKRALAIADEKDITQELQYYTLENASLEEIGEAGSFIWDHPPHMAPTGLKPLNEIRETLREQLYRCMCQLELLQNGQGAAYQMTMSVNGLGKLDIYQYIYFLALHAKRHALQLDRYASSPQAQDICSVAHQEVI